jgi:hypothetical protein
VAVDKKNETKFKKIRREEIQNPVEKFDKKNAGENWQSPLFYETENNDYKLRENGIFR